MLVVCELAATCQIDKTICVHHKVSHQDDGHHPSCHGICQLRSDRYGDLIWCSCVPVPITILRKAKLKEMGLW